MGVFEDLIDAGKEAFRGVLKSKSDEDLIKELKDMNDSKRTQSLEKIREFEPERSLRLEKKMKEEGVVVNKSSAMTGNFTRAGALKLAAAASLLGVGVGAGIENSQTKTGSNALSQNSVGGGVSNQTFSQTGASSGSGGASNGSASASGSASSSDSKPPAALSWSAIKADLGKKAFLGMTWMTVVIIAIFFLGVYFLMRISTARSPTSDREYMMGALII